MSEWRPIETAPRDGTFILVRFAGTLPPGMWVVQWDEAWAGEPGTYGADWAWHNGAAAICRDATHWMPLPDPPA